MNAKLVKLLLPCAAMGAIATSPASLAQAPAPPPAPPPVAPPPAPSAASSYSNQLPETRARCGASRQPRSANSMVSS